MVGLLLVIWKEEFELTKSSFRVEVKLFYYSNVNFAPIVLYHDAVCHQVSMKRGCIHKLISYIYINT